MAQPLFALHPMSAGDLIDRAVRIYRRHFLSIFRLALIPGSIAMALNVYAARLENLAFSWWVTVLAAGCLTTFIDAVLVRWIANPGMGQASLWKCYRPMLRRAASLIIASVLTTTLALVSVFAAAIAIATAVNTALVSRGGSDWADAALALLGLGGSSLVGWLVMCRWSVAVAVLAVEEMRLGRALQRSWRLVRGNTWRAGAVMLFDVAISLGPAVPFILWDLAGTDDGSLVKSMITDAIELLLGPLSGLASGLLYFDCRVRKEAFDLEVAVAAMERAPGAARPAGQLQGPAPDDTPDDRGRRELNPA
jgi:hypothetical protein